MCETSQVSSGWRLRERRGDRTPALGAARVVPPVGAHAEQRLVVRRQPGRPAGAQRGEVEVEQLARVRDHAGLEPRARPGRRTPRRPACLVLVPQPVVAADHQHPHPRGPGRRGQAGSDAVGQPAVAERVDAPRAGVLDQQERPHRRRGAGQRLVASTLARAHGGQRSGTVRSTATTSSSPSRTSRRHSTSRLCASSARQVGGPQLGAGRGPSRARGAASRARRGSGRRAAPRPGSPRSSSTHGWPGRRRSSVVVGRGRGPRGRRAARPRGGARGR